ncbi:hypothetical protein SO802_014660 [Lithocarpus litseifolius]|uniref:Trichome birefringence-like N-terminal domain-containing protein n=1 Tax=Lithocarpus litseifolius TaxID=425828 RepID=A0AAW2CTT8_9ROSI
MSYKVQSDHLGNIGQHGKKICSSCNYFQGSWVVDNHYPLYDAARCPFTKKDFNRQKNGRPADMEYLKYIWKPNSCLIPSFDALEFLMRQRGKKIMFVGDSLSYNMWQSLTCKLYTAAPNSNYTYNTESQLYTVSFLEYGVSVMFLRNEFLVDLVDTKIGRVLKLDSLSTGNLWKIADVLNFNTNHWWTHTGRAQTWDYFQVGQKIFKEMNRTQAYKIGLSTWATWIYANINPLNTQVFYQGVSAVHYYDKQLDLNAKNCQRQTQVFGATFPGPSSSTSTPGEAVVKKRTAYCCEACRFA